MPLADIEININYIFFFSFVCSYFVCVFVSGNITVKNNNKNDNP